MLTVHIISDSIGNTAKDVVNAALVQFSYSDVRYKILKNSNVSTKDKIESIVDNMEKYKILFFLIFITFLFIIIHRIFKKFCIFFSFI